MFAPSVTRKSDASHYKFAMIAQKHKGMSYTEMEFEEQDLQ